jgi:hypothetical protein
MKTLATSLAAATVAALLTAAPAQATLEATEPQPPSRPRAVHVGLADGGEQISIGWLEPTRTGSRPIIRRYVIRSNHGELIVGRGTTNVIVSGAREPGRYVFKVKAVSRAGSSPWARSAAVYIK